MSTPPTPIHPAPNEEVRNFPNEKIPDSTLADIDLNPDLYDEDDDDQDMDNDTPTNNQSNDELPVNNTNGIAPRNPLLDTLKQSEMVDDSESEMEEVDLYKFQQITLPFQEAYELFTIEFNSIEPSPISQQQQSKFVNYIDDHLLRIQRKFIKSQTEDTPTYSFIQLINELSEVINIIWVSISKKNPLFGQMDYYIKILGDIEDYLSHYKRLFNDEFTVDSVKIDLTKLVTFFKFFQKVDLQISMLIDGYDTNSKTITKANSTQLIRLYPIITRLRILIIEKMEDLRFRLNNARVQTHNKQVSNDSQNLLNLFEVEISRLFEGILDRAS